MFFSQIFGQNFPKYKDYLWNRQAAKPFNMRKEFCVGDFQ